MFNYEMLRLSLLATAVLLASAAAATKKNENDTCDVEKILPIKSRTELDHAARIITGDIGVECPKRVKQMVEHFQKILSFDAGAESCSSLQLNRIDNFADSFVYSSELNMGSQMRALYLAYGLKMSQRCRHRLTNLLLEDSSKLLTREQLEWLDRLAGERSQLAQIITESDDLTLPENLIFFVAKQRKAAELENKIHVEVSSGANKVFAIQNLCRKKFAPLYEATLMPLVRMSWLGFNYETKSGRELTSASGDKKKQTLKWYRVMFLCEALENLEVIEADEEHAKKVSVRFISKSKAEKLKKRQGYRVNELGNFDSAIDYSPVLSNNGVPVEDLIYDTKDAELMTAVSNFSEPKREKNRPKFLRRLSDSLKEKIRNGALNLSLDLDGKGSGEVKDSSDLMQLVDEYAKQVERSNKSYSRMWRVLGIASVITILVWIIGSVSAFIAAFG